jgi:hypothetical protein
MLLLLLLLLLLLSSNPLIRDSVDRPGTNRRR